MITEPRVARDADAWKRQDRAYHERREVAETYDRRVARFYRLDHRRYTLDRWAEQLETTGARRVLDFGCGTGTATLRFRARGFEVVSIDASLAMLAVVREKARRAGARVSCVVADGGRLPFRDGSFDAVVCTGVLHHMPEPAAAVGAQARVLGPGGRLFVSEPYAELPWFSRPGRWLFELVKGLRDRLRGQSGEGARERLLDRRDAVAVTDVLEAEGFAYNISRFTYWPYVCGFAPEALAWPLMRVLDSLKPTDRGDAIRFEATRSLDAPHT